MAHLCQRRAAGDKHPLRLETFDQFSAEDYNYDDRQKNNFRRKVKLNLILMTMLVQAVMITMMMVSRALAKICRKNKIPERRCSSSSRF